MTSDLVISFRDEWVLVPRGGGKGRLEPVTSDLHFTRHVLQPIVLSLRVCGFLISDHANLRIICLYYYCQWLWHERYLLVLPEFLIGLHWVIASSVVAIFLYIKEKKSLWQKFEQSFLWSICWVEVVFFNWNGASVVLVITISITMVSLSVHFRICSWLNDCVTQHV